MASSINRMRSKIEEAERRTERDIGNLLKKLRVDCGMSQIEFANKLGVSYQQQHKYESGAQHISAARLRRAAELLNVPTAVFFSAEHISPETPTTRQTLELLRVFRQLDDEMRFAALAFIHAIDAFGQRMKP